MEDQAEKADDLLITLDFVLHRETEVSATAPKARILQLEILAEPVQKVRSVDYLSLQLHDFHLLAGSISFGFQFDQEAKNGAYKRALGLEL